MWKRIHSNRDPRDTLYSEVRKEFSIYFEIAGRFGRSFLSSYPKLIFGSMLVIMLSSMLLVFTVFRPKEQVAVAGKASVIKPVSDGFFQIMQATGKIRETIRLKHIVDSISAKTKLSPSDSTRLESALSSLQHIHSPANN